MYGLEAMIYLLQDPISSKVDVYLYIILGPSATLFEVTQIQL